MADEFYEERTWGMFIAGVLYLIFGAACLILFHIRKGKRTIRSRSPLLIEISAWSGVLVLFYISLRQKYFPESVCPDVFWVLDLFFVLQVTPYLLRCVRLYYFYYTINQDTELRRDTQRLYLGESVPRHALPKFKNKKWISEKFLTMVLMVVVLVFCLILLAIQFAVPDLDGKDQEKCQAFVGQMLGLVGIIVIVFVGVFAYAIYKLRAVQDEFNFNRELQIICVVSVFCMVTFFVMWFAGWRWPNDPYPVWPFAILIVTTLVVSVMWPLKKSFAEDSRRRRSTHREASDGMSQPLHSEFGSFDELLADDQHRSLFETFLVRSFSLPVLKFWESIQSFKSHRLTPDDKLWIESERLVLTFASQESHMEIEELSQEHKSKLLNCLKNKSVSRDMFDEVEGELREMLDDDLFPRFLNSATYLLWKKKKGRAIPML